MGPDRTASPFSPLGVFVKSFCGHVEAITVRVHIKAAGGRARGHPLAAFFLSFAILAQFNHIVLLLLLLFGHRFFLCPKHQLCDAVKHLHKKHTQPLLHPSLCHLTTSIVNKKC